MRLLGIALVLCCARVGGEWICPELSARPAAECSCDLPHTLRCAGDHTALQIIGRHLRESKARNKSSAVSLLDLALRGVSSLTAASVSELSGVGLHGLVISSGDIRRVQQGVFGAVASTLLALGDIRRVQKGALGAVASTLLALGLPNNQLPVVPTEAITRLTHLQRLDLSNNKIHTLDSTSFKGMQNLTYLDLSDNQLTVIAQEAFKPLTKLTVLRLRGNLLKVSALASLKEAVQLQDLDLSSNALEGPLGPTTVPPLAMLTILQLSDNTFASIRRGALAGLPNLLHLNVHNNQIDVLEDFAFKHLTNLTHLDLSHNEIVAVSGLVMMLEVAVAQRKPLSSPLCGCKPGYPRACGSDGKLYASQCELHCQHEPNHLVEMPLSFCLRKGFKPKTLSHNIPNETKENRPRPNYSPDQTHENRPNRPRPNYNPDQTNENRPRIPNEHRLKPNFLPNTPNQYAGSDEYVFPTYEGDDYWKG